MTKKKTKKTVNYDQQIEDLTDLILKAAISITETNKRIDRIVSAIDKSKKVTGL